MNFKKANCLYVLLTVFISISQVQGQTLDHIVLVGPSQVSLNEPAAFTIEFKDSSGTEIEMPLGQAYWDIEDGYSQTEADNYCIAKFTAEGQGYIQAQFYYQKQYYNADLYVSVATNGISLPSQIVVSNVTFNSFTIDWTYTGTSYLIDVAYNSNFTRYVGEFQNISGPFTFNQYLNPSTTYWIRVSSSSNGTIVSTILPVTTGSVPQALPASYFSENRFQVNWMSYPGATGYQLDVSDNNSFSSYIYGYHGKAIENLKVASIIDGLDPGTTYYYRIRALTGLVLSSNSNVVITSTLPVVPQAIEPANITSTSFKANWTMVNGATSYKLDVATDASFNSLVSSYNNITVTGNNRSVTNLASGEEYYYRIKAVNSSGATRYSNTIELTTTSTGLTQPMALDATEITTSKFIANWSAVSGALHYQIDVSSDVNFKNRLYDYNNLTIDGTSKTIFIRLKAGTNYYYRVCAIFSEGTSVSSNIKSVRLISSPPTATKATQLLSDSFVANWDPSIGASGYLVDVSTTNSFDSFVGNYQDYSVQNSNLNVVGLNDVSQYFYRIRAVNVSGVSEFSNVIQALDNDQNYIQSVDMLNEGVSEIFETTKDGNGIIITKYFDGLGRLLQVVNKQASPNGNDLIQPISYDQFNRQPLIYLPYVANESKGRFQPGFVDKNDASYELSPQFQFYQTAINVSHSLNPYSETIFEASPLNQVVKQGAVGKEWQPDPENSINSSDHTLKYENMANEENTVIRFNYSSGVINLDENNINYYPSGELVANKSKDEHGSEIVTYVDKEGRAVCKKVQYGTDSSANKLYASTYYIYDDFGNLVVVLPPEGVKALVPDAN